MAVGYIEDKNGRVTGQGTARVPGSRANTQQGGREGDFSCPASKAPFSRALS